MSDQVSVKQILQQTEETLQTARHGYEDFSGEKFERRMSGLRNFVVFGRSVTYALQNLRSVVGKDAFDAWYIPRQEAMSRDPVCKHMNNVRNEILKEGKLAVSRSLHIHQFDTSMIDNFYKPRNAEGFFVGDHTGGSGWIVRQPDGSTEPYYVDMPTSAATSTQFFTDLRKLDPEGGGRSVDDVAAHYLRLLEELVNAAKQHFLGVGNAPPDGRRRGHLRLVK